MKQLGKKSEILGSEHLIPLKIPDRPEEMPPLPEPARVLCGYDQGFGEVLVLCENLEDMQGLYDSFIAGGAVSIAWYYGYILVVTFEYHK